MKTWIKLLQLGRRDTYHQVSTYLWIIIVIIVFILYALNIIDVNISDESLLTASIAGLSFTIAVFSVMNVAINKKSLIYYAKYALWKQNYAFFETFAGFIWVALLFSISFFVSVIAIFLSDTYISNYIELTNILIISLAVFSMFELVVDVVWQTVSNVRSEFHDNKFMFLNILKEEKAGTDVSNIIKKYLDDYCSATDRDMILEILLYLKEQNMIKESHGKIIMLKDGEKLFRNMKGNDILSKSTNEN
ncbi:hypothetical protein [Limosilactobacillus reuteri]|uniref:ABC transporter permease n=1 Tax=Limosilactobacillus reuteri TaxID=1598 RepID=A0AB36AHP8_LIMRT|nr:hypothetical protein [Limosilactobacillus reuteri]MCH5358551.1 hypothetical protein [Limosilactobacillus reuteri]MRG84308.1 hypothetical protein [Limosilactobacillus reuteri]